MNDKPTPEGTELRTVEFPTADGVVRGKVAVTTGPMRLTGLVQTAFDLTNALVSRAVQAEQAAGRALTCRAGCAACCRHMVPVSPPEAFFIADMLDGLPAERRELLQARFDHIVQDLDRRRMIGHLLEPEPTDSAVLPVAREYFALQHACPFLEHESCGIHPHRPVACRDYNVTTPAAWCQRPYDEAVAKIPLPLPLSVPLSRTAAIVTGQRPVLIPLTLVPWWTAEHKRDRTQTWPGLELFDLFLDQLRKTYE